MPEKRSESASRPWAIYGATGVTGGLILRRALAAGLRPRLVGRPSPRLAALATEHALEFRPAALDVPEALAGALSGCSAMINVAGPFIDTAGPLVEACVRTGVDYLDLSGELASLRQVLALDRQARAAGVVLIPGAGFGVAATDVLACRVSDRLSGADTLRISVAAGSGFGSEAVAASTLAVLAGGGWEVSGGSFVRTRLARHRWRERHPDGSWISFASAPLADLAGALQATGAREIVAGVPMPTAQAIFVSTISPLVPRLTRIPAIARHLANTGGHAASGDAASLRSRTWVSGTNGGQRVAMMLDGGEGFALAADMALHALKALGATRRAAGAFTPAGAFGPKWLDDLQGVRLSLSE